MKKIEKIDWWLLNDSLQDESYESAIKIINERLVDKVNELIEAYNESSKS